MEKVKFIIIGFALFSNTSGSNFNLPSIGPDRPLTECMMGPFKTTTTRCFLRERKYNGCILEGLNLFHVDGILCPQKVWNTFRSELKHQDMELELKRVVGKCVVDANQENNFTGVERGHAFVRCLNRMNAFIDLFPTVFCERAIVNEVRTPQGMVSGISPSSVPSTNPSHRCEFGPFDRNADRCITSDGTIRSCLLDYFPYFTDNYVDFQRMWMTIRPYIQNSGGTNVVRDILTDCARDANNIMGNRNDVTAALVECWNEEDILPYFRRAFCADNPAGSDQTTADLGNNRFWDLISRRYTNTIQP